MVELLVATAMGLCIGAACRRFDVPLPAPTEIVGAALVFAMTAGYILAGHLTVQLP